MVNFEAASTEYRERIQFQLDDLFDPLVKDHLLKGGDFDGTKITRMFHTCIRTAQLMVDLSIGAGIYPLEKEERKKKNDDDKNRNTTDNTMRDFNDAWAEAAFAKRRDAVGDLGTRNPEGPTGNFGDEGRVRNPGGSSDPIDVDRTAGGGQVDPPQQQPTSHQLGPGTGRGHSGGPAGSPIHTASEHGSGSIGPSVPDVRRQADSSETEGGD